MITGVEALMVLLVPQRGHDDPDKKSNDKENAQPDTGH
jgi:hypothetical protein